MWQRSRRHTPRQQRQEILKTVFDDQVLEFTENNDVAQVIMFLEDVIKAIPHNAVDRDQLGIAFNVAAKRVLGK